MNKPAFIKLSSLKAGTQFFFTDPALEHGVNDLTCFKRTPLGYTNNVTRKFTRSTRDADVVESYPFSTWKQGLAEAALHEVKSLMPGVKLTRPGQSHEAGGWRAYACQRGPSLCVELMRGEERHMVYAPTFNQ